MDFRSKRRVIEDFRKQGIDAVHALPAWHVRDNDTLLELQKDGIMKSRVEINGTEVLPLTGVANKLTVLCNEGGDYITYYSDRHGFNNPQDVWDKSPADVVAVGDSFTQGWCVTPNKNFVALIRQRYPATINLGIEGSGPLVALAAIKEYAQSLKPKVVLWFYYEANDLSDLDNERRSALLLAYMTRDSANIYPADNPKLTALSQTIFKEGSKRLRRTTGC